MAISFRPNKKHQRLFKEAVKGSWHFPFALLLSICLMCLDRNYKIVPIHRVFASLVYPLQYIVEIPGRLISNGRVLWHTKQALLNETKTLYEEHLQLKAALQQLTALERENTQLNRVLELSRHAKHQMMAAKTFAFETRKTRHLLMINKGKKAGVLPGQLVLDTKGVLGQVIDVGAMTSTILLISDAASAVPVRNQRTGETAILEGTNHPGHLSLSYLPKTASVMKGDILVTSGLGGYPEDYPVGTVARVDNPLGESFIRVDVRPFTHYYHDRVVLLVWPDKKGRKA